MTVDDLSGTSVKSVEADLGAGDGQSDKVIVNGTAAADTFQVGAASGATRVSGQAATIEVSGEEPADSVQVTGGDGTDAAIVSGSDSADAIQIAAAAPDVVLSGCLARARPDEHRGPLRGRRRWRRFDRRGHRPLRSGRDDDRGRRR